MPLSLSEQRLLVVLRFLWYSCRLNRSLSVWCEWAEQSAKTFYCSTNSLYSSPFVHVLQPACHHKPFFSFFTLWPSVCSTYFYSTLTCSQLTVQPLADWACSAVNSVLLHSLLRAEKVTIDKVLCIFWWHSFSLKQSHVLVGAICHPVKSNQSLIL